MVRSLAGFVLFVFSSVFILDHKKSNGLITSPRKGVKTSSYKAPGGTIVSLRTHESTRRFQPSAYHEEMEAFQKYQNVHVLYTPSNDLSRIHTTTTRRYSQLGDYSDAAHGLFGNVIGAASLITSSLIQFIFTSDKMPQETSNERRRRNLFLSLGILSLGCNVVSIMYATVACNKLVETANIAPATSAFALIKRDYELSWLGTNLGFLGGLCGFLITIALRVYAFYPTNIRLPSAGLASGTMLLAISIINRGVEQGDGQGRSYGGSILSLIGRYMFLIGKNTQYRGPLSIGAALIGILSLAMLVKSFLITPKEASIEAGIS